MKAIVGFLLGMTLLTGVCVGSRQVHAATPTLTVGGRLVSWPSRRLEVVGNPTNRSGLSAAQVFDAAVRGLQRWKAAGLGALSFDYWQGTDDSNFEANSKLNGHSSLYFASRSGTSIDPQVLGLTQVWYNTETGETIETDIVLNDVNYQFSTRPTDTSGHGSGSTTGNTVFIENVLTHELGHAFGLSHSGALQSTMLFMEAPDQNHLGCDDQLGLRGIYGGGAGSVVVRVHDPSGRALMGAQVAAISRQKGTVLRTAISDRDGMVRLSALESGAYDLMVEPYYAGSAPLPAYYSGMNLRVCGQGELFKRTFRTAMGSQRLESVQVVSGRESDAGVMTVGCSWTAGAPSTDNEQRTVVRYGESDGAFVGRWENGISSRHRLRIEHSGGDLVARMLSFSLYSPISVRASLWNEGGQGVLISERSPLYQSESGYNNYDTEIRGQSLSAGVYYLDLSADSISVHRYPAGPLSRDSQSFYVVEVLRSTVLATQSRCRQNESFGSYQSPAGAPPRHDISGQGSGGFAACATVSSIHKKRGGGTMEFMLMLALMFWMSRPTVALARARA